MNRAIARIEWRRPVIADVTPNRRPDADTVAARHGEVRKHHRKQRKRRAEETPEKPEDLRLAHLRWRELIRLLQYRYRTEMPDTAEARRDIAILINYAILTDKKPQHIVEVWAPWLDQDELDHMAAHQRPILHKADDLAKRLDLHYFDRQRLSIRTIGAVDVDHAERDRLRLERRNEAKRQKRAAANQEEKPMSHRQRAVLEKIDHGADAVPELVKQLARHKAFRGVAAASLRKVVHRTVDELLAAGEIADRYAPNPCGGRPIRHVSRPQQ
jgi:hypothetical protein